MLLPVRTQAPAEMPVALEEARQHLIVSGFTDDDEQIKRFIQAATDHLERTLNIALVTQTWKQSFCSFNSLLQLRMGPVASVDAVKYYDADNVEQVVFNTAYSALKYAQGTVIQASTGDAWPVSANRADAVTVEYKSGSAAADVPASLKAAILMHVGLMYSYRGDPEGPRIEDNSAYAALIWPFRRPKV
ncbi:head-tail connector protein [Paenochrobactrum pullorum]|uniref:head-tail connector protein n=1 Tax=Paenochrobactrum pullorum TaxID=1324351 RepID=UPI0035BC6F18